MRVDANKGKWYNHFWEKENLGKLKVRREDAVYIGDSDVDIQTAKNAGFACISVTWSATGSFYCSMVQ